MRNESQHQQATVLPTDTLPSLVLDKTTTTHQSDAWGQLLRATTHMQGVNFSPELANNRSVIRALVLALSDRLSTHITERADCIVLRPAAERLCEVVPVRRPLTKATAKAATESASCIPQGVSITRADLADEYHLPWPPRAPEWSGTDACLLQLHASTEALIADIDANLSPASIQARVSDLAARFASGPSRYINASDVPTPTPSTFYTSYIDASAQALLDQISATLTPPWLAQNPQWSTALEHTHTYDALGRITHTQEVLLGNPQADKSYSYDPQGRLSVVTAGAATTTWNYDANGNRTHENGILIAHYDRQDQLLDWRGTTYHYNPAGDLSQKTTANGTTTYHYDAQGNLRQVTLEDGRILDYAIDPNNRRTGKSLNGQRQWQLLWQSPIRPIARLKADGTLEALYYYADKPNVPEAMDKDGKTYRIVSDHLGSVRLVIDTDTGEIAQRMDYDPWGKVLYDSNPGFQPFGFAGGLYDPDTGLTRFGARDYDAETGRWTAKDPILFNGGDSNLYGYVVQDPVNYFDSMGLSATSAAKCFFKGAAWGALGAVAVGVAATALAVVGVPAAIITTALAVGAAAGAVTFGVDTTMSVQNSNWDHVAYNLGGVIGGAATGAAGGRLVAEGVNGVKSPPWSWSSDKSQIYDPNYPNGSLGQWWGTGPNPGSAAGSMAAGGYPITLVSRSDCGC